MKKIVLALFGVMVALTFILGTPLLVEARATAEFDTVNKIAIVTGTATDVTFWTPATGKRFAIQGCAFSSKNSTTVELEVSNVDVIMPVHIDSRGIKVIGGDESLLYVSDVDDVLTYSVTEASLNSSGVFSLSIMCWGYEVR